MSEPIAIYQRVVDRFTELVDSIDAGQWSAATPCEGWTVRDLLEHVVVRDIRIASSVGGPDPVELPADVDLVQAWHERVSWWAAGLADPTRRDRQFATAMGEMTFEQATARFMTGELTVHAWDLAKGLGIDERLDPEAVDVAFASMRGAADMLRRPGIMGPEVPVGDDSDQQEKFLAFTGRTA
jgi:uncharacterized protein (TIGR03086 family)